MSSEFDPYRIWLGIPVSEQPANLYRLLGLALFESDDDVISNAADRQMAHVRTFQTGKYSEQSQKLLNELSAARVTLLDKKKKAEYDAKLKSELDTSSGSSMVNLGAGSTLPQGSFIGGQSSVNLSPPPINGPEGSLLGVNLGLSSASKKKRGAGASDKNVKEKSGKGASGAVYSGSKRTATKKNNNIGMIAGVVCGVAALLIAALVLMVHSKAKTEDEDDFDPSYYSGDTEFYNQPAPQQVSQNPQAQPGRSKADRQRNKGEKRNHKKNNPTEDTNKDDFALPEAVGDSPVIPESTESKANKPNPESAAPESASGKEDAPVDLAQLTAAPGQVKAYSQIPVKPIDSFLLFQEGVQGRQPLSALRQTSDRSHLLVGDADNGKAAVVNVATGDVAFSLSPSTVGRFAVCNVTPDGKMYYLAVNPSKATLMQYQADLVSDELISQSEPKEFRPNSFIFRFDANGNPVKESDAQFNAFVTFKGYQIIQVAAPFNSSTGLMAVALTDGLIHIVNVETGSDFMRFYPSDSPAPVPVWTTDSIETAKKEKDKFKELFKVIKPSVLPTTMVFQSDKYLATGNTQGEAFVWNTDEYSPITETVIPSLQQLTKEFSVRESQSPVINMRFDSTGQKLYIFWADGHVGVWDWKNKTAIKKGFVEQNVKYAQILADKYLLVQNDKGEVSIWSWDTEKVNQVGIFKRLTEQVIADPDQLLFWATERGSANSTLTMYALPADFIEAMNSPEFASLFKMIIIYHVPEEAKWKAKMADAATVIEKHLKDLSDDQKKAKIQELVDKLPENLALEPDLRYAFYMKFIELMAQLKDKERTLELIDCVAKEFDVDKNELKLEVYLLLLKELKGFERIKAANELLNLCEKMLPASSNRGMILEIVKKVRLENYSKDISERAKMLQKQYSN